jgi:hypothetical protein
MQVAGIRRVGARVEMIEVGEPRPLAGDEVLVEVRGSRRGQLGRPHRRLGRGCQAADGAGRGGGRHGASGGPGGRRLTPADVVMTHPVPLRGQGTWAPRLIAPADRPG